jgi:DNA polymerase-1
MGITTQDAPILAPAAGPVGVDTPADILLMDVNNFLYAAMYTPLGNLQFEGFPTGGIHGTLNSIFARMADRPGALPVVLWDCKAQWRYELLPDYKGSRFATPEKQAIRESARMQAPIVRMILSALGIPQVTCGGAEADDLAGVICRHIDPSWYIELNSGDTDWWQALAANVSWYSNVHKMSLSLERFSDPEAKLKDGHFITTAEYLQCKALSGDTSDEIPGIEGVGLRTAAKIIRAHGGDIRNLWSGIAAGEVRPKGVIEARVATAEAQAMFERNIKLMDWSLAPEIDVSCLALTAGRPDWSILTQAADDFGLKKVRSRAEAALKPWSAGWGEALWAVDGALNYTLCQQNPKPGQRESA